MMDTINGLFEVSGGFFLLPTIIHLLKEKKVAGVSWIYVAFFSSWGIWNLIYYPSIGQTHSFYGGIFLVFMNTTYMVLLIYYTRKQRV